MNESVFAENLRHLRQESKLKQADMHSVLGFNQSTWNNYERGVSLPKMADLEKISDHFKILESDLLHTELTEHANMEEIRERYFACKHPELLTKNAGNAKVVGLKTIAGQRLIGQGDNMPSVVTVDAGGNDNIVYVPIRAQAGYLHGYADKEYMEGLPSFHMPGLNNGTYRMFEVQGVSMAPTLQDKDRVIAEWVPNVEEIRDNRVHIIVHKEGVAIKRVLNRVRERQKIYLKSDTLTYKNDYPIREIDPSEVLEVWYVRLKISPDLSEPSEIYTRVSNLELNQYEIMKAMGIR